jgi:hypothetical protein
MSIFDNAISAGVKMAVNQMLADIGSISQLHLDIKAKTVTATVELVGEVSPIDFQVGKYELSKKDDGVYITLKEITCSREWLQKAVQKFEPEPQVKLPEKLASAVSFAGMVQ